MTCQPFRELIITDGTSTDEGVPNAVSLLNCASGFCLTDWMPSIAPKKGGGTWANSAMSDGRRMRFFKRDNAIETYTLQIRSPTQDALIRETQKLRRLLEKAVAYWTTEWQNEPVWIEAIGTGETEKRYSIIRDYSTPQDDDPYREPFIQGVIGSGMEDWQLIVEREPTWRSTEPGTGTATNLSAVEAFDGRNLGNVDASGVRDPTTADEVYVANKRNVANLTNVYIDDGGVFGGNLMNQALPFRILPIAPAVGDHLYFGCRVALADSGPFCSLVFDLSVAGAGYTGTWEYWNGAWVALTVQDNTDQDGAMTGISFDTLGVNSIHWRQPSDWTNTVINAVDAFWVRYRVTGIPGALTAPQQQNRDIYSIVWPYVEIEQSVTGGDIPMLSRLRLVNQSEDGTGLTVTPGLLAQNVLVGLRSYSRGANFTAYLNCADEQNPAGVTVAVGVNTAFVNRSQSPTGRSAQYNPAGVEALADRVIFTLDNTIVTDYYGRYRVFVRGDMDPPVLPSPLTVRVAYINGSGGLVTYSKTSTSFPVYIDSVVELGTIEIPGGSLDSSDVGDQSQIVIQAGSTSGIPNIYFYDLVLVPIDEWAGEYLALGLQDSNTYKQYRRLDIDSVVFPKVVFRSLLRETTNDRVVAYWQPITVGPSVLQANARQRLWFFGYRASSSLSDDRDVSELELASTVLITRVQRYLSMRGDR